MTELLAKLYARVSAKYHVVIQFAMEFMPYAAVVYLRPKSGPGEPAPVAVLPPGAPARET